MFIHIDCYFTPTSFRSRIYQRVCDIKKSKFNLMPMNVS